MRFAGIILPITTPFERDRISAVRLRDNIARYEEAGVDGYLLLGSSGEAVLLDVEEKAHVFREARAAIPSTKPMIAGVGLEATSATIRLARIAADSGADLLLVLTPHYYGEQVTGPMLESHYRSVGDASPLPLLLYNVPKFTHVNIPVDTVVALGGHERIVGIKDSSGDLDRLAELSSRTGDDFAIICGHHGVFLDALSRGIRAGILAAADPFPAAYVELHRLADSGKSAAAQALHAQLSGPSGLAVSTFGVPGIKAAMDICGMYGGPPRPPLLPLGEPERSRLRGEIEKLERSGVPGRVG